MNSNQNIESHRPPLTLSHEHYIVKSRCTPQHIPTTYVCCGEHQHMLWATPKKRHPQHIVTHNIYDERVLSTTYLHNICTVSTTYRHPQDMHSTTYACTPQHTSTTYKTLSTTCSVMDTRTTYLRLFWISCGGHFGAIFIGCGAHLICCGEQAVYVVDNTLGICCG